MIEITPQQLLALNAPDATPLRVVNPATQEAFILLRAEEYERLKELSYDDSPWTREEIEALAWETRKMAGGDETDEYDQIPDAK